MRAKRVLQAITIGGVIVGVFTLGLRKSAEVPINRPLKKEISISSISKKNSNIENHEKTKKQSFSEKNKKNAHSNPLLNKSNMLSDFSIQKMDSSKIIELEKEDQIEIVTKGNNKVEIELLPTKEDKKDSITIEVNQGAVISEEKDKKEKDNIVLSTTENQAKTVTSNEKNEIKNTGNIDNQLFIKEVKVNNLVSLKSQVNKIKKEYENKPFSNEGLQSLLKELNNLYLKEGYITTRVKIKVPQDLKSGILELEMINGYVDEIIQNKNKFRDKLSTFFAFPGMKKRILNIKNVEQGIKQINSVGSNSAKMKIVPGEKFETSNIEVSTEKRRPYSLTIAYDNYGEKSTGTDRGTISLGLNNLLGINDTFNFSYKRNLGTIDENYLKEYSGNYSFPFGFYRFSVNGSNSKTLTTVKGNLKDIEYVGETEKVKYEIKRDIYASTSNTAYAKIDLEISKSRNYVENVELIQSKKDLRIGSLELGLTHKYDRGYLSTSIEFEKGLSIFDGTDDAKAKFSKYTLSLSGSRVFECLNNKLSYDFQINGQYSDNILYSSNKMSLGDLGTIRGFKENSVSGEQGAYIRNTLSYRLSNDKRILKNSKVFLGLDAGLTKDLSYEEGSKYSKVEKLTGVSTGYQYSNNNFNLDLTFGKALTKPDYFTDEKYVVSLTSSVSY